MEENEIIILVVCLIGAIILIAFLAFLWKRYIKDGPVYHSDKSLVGKTVIITGGNAGIGKATAIQCAKLKAHLIIASRNVEKSMKARDEIIKETGHHDIHVMKLDLADLDSVSKFADEILSKEKHIDFLINNAGVLWVPGVTKQGFNNVFGINHLGHFLLTNLLMDRMKEQSSTRPVRIINVSSGAYELAYDTDFLTAHLEAKKPDGIIEMFTGYGVSKLANIYFSSELARRLKDYDITSYSLHPGAVESEIGTATEAYSTDEWYSWKVIRGKLLFLLAQPFLRSGYYGTQTTMSAMLDDHPQDVNGAYFEQCKPQQFKDFATQPQVGEFLWKQSVKLLSDWLPTTHV